MSFLEQPGFADDVRSVLTDLLGLPPAFMDYTVQYNALNGLAIPISQIAGFTQFTPTIATRINTFETTTSTTYTDLATSGPQLTKLPDGKYVFFLGARASVTGSGEISYMSLSYNGSTAIDSDAASASVISPSAGGVFSVATAALSNNGSSTVTAKYRSSLATSTAGFNARFLVAIKYANN